MKISFLFFFLAMCSTISSERDERFPTVKSDEIRDPLPSCPKDCPLCHNHCVLTNKHCKEKNCTLIVENNVTLPVCSLGCWKGLCPDTSISVKFYGDPCKKCDGQSRCENYGMCHYLPNDATQDEKFVCDCPEPFHGKYCGRWGEIDNQFVLSRVGKNCKNSISNESLCRESTKLLKDSTYATLNDAGNDLPYGCISDKTNKDNHYVFWNPNGVARSADPHVREICSITKDPLEGLECAKDYTKPKKPEADIENRIRESEDSCQVKPHSKPWIVRLKIGDKGYCGGTLIGKKTVITAAHCVCEGNLFEGMTCNLWENTTVILGDHHRTETDCGDTIEKEQCFRIKFAEVYKDWNGLVIYGNDIALFTLDEQVTLNPNVQIAHLPEPDAPCPNGMNLVVSGWGTYPAWNNSDPLLDYGPNMLGVQSHQFLWAVKQQCVDKEDCKKHYKFGDVTLDIPDSILCVVGPRTGGINGPYLGDSGGPLTYTKNGNTTLYGVVSFLVRVLDHPTKPTKISLPDESMFARVSQPDILKWINDFKQKYEND